MTEQVNNGTSSWKSPRDDTAASSIQTSSRWTEFSPDLGSHSVVLPAATVTLVAETKPGGMCAKRRRDC
ncbi:hypothetical protein C8034_v011885 [Colletotrichum sidae]|uniref:Uncharacterized protein n=1 Tax=Colletotrichum sidae TaxID=1347389 RepID=A0A4R8T0R1_9PEZI|nr:hypothetical protein C8034_v011885 [Colletotrichum sidae]